MAKMYESPRLKRPTQRGMSLLAIKVLEELAASAQAGPIPMTDAARLAIGWLMHAGIAVNFQAGRFVAAITKNEEANGTVEGYMRRTEMYQMLEAWRREIRNRDRTAAERDA